jgi:hypothetical protein
MSSRRGRGQGGVAIHRRGRGRGIAPTHEQKVVVNVPELPVVPVIAQLPNIKAINPRPIHFDLRGQPQVEAQQYNKLQIIERINYNIQINNY